MKLTKITVLICLMLFLKVLDLYSTFLCVNKFNIYVELNPIVRCSLYYWGNCTYLINFLIFALLMIPIYKYKLVNISMILSFILFLVVCNNFWALT